MNVPGLPFDLSLPRVMGVLNVTPDSFSDGGRFLDRELALRHAERLVDEGADVLDVGGESTRPGAKPVSLDEESTRVLPLIERLRAEFDVPISIDTSKPELMSLAVAAGAKLINDVSALSAPRAIEVLAPLDVPICLMHMQGEPRTMQQAPQYGDVVADIIKYLGDRVVACEAGGICRQRLLIDPGFGFGKSLQHNLAVLSRLREFANLRLPLLVGLSRKSMLGRLTNRPVEERLAASVAAAVVAVERGAQIVRVHDVAATVDALQVWQAVTATDLGR